MRPSWLYLTMVAVATPLACVGCGSSNNPVKVSGKVTIEGKPLANARVCATLPSGGGRPAFGETDSGGNFTMTTVSPGDGVVPGKYKVTVEPAIKATQKTPDPKEDPRARAAQGSQPVKDESGIHPNYRRVDTTPLILEVPPKEAVKFDLKADGK